MTDFRQSVIRGATERLVPILMTALGAGLALVPIALSAGQAGSRKRRDGLTTPGVGGTPAPTQA